MNTTPGRNTNLRMGALQQKRGSILCGPGQELWGVCSVQKFPHQRHFADSSLAQHPLGTLHTPALTSKLLEGTEKALFLFPKMTGLFPSLYSNWRGLLTCLMCAVAPRS